MMALPMDSSSAPSSRERAQRLFKKMEDFTERELHGREHDIDVVEVGSVDAGVWPDDIEEIFISIMEKEVLKGNRTSTTFSKVAWHSIGDALNAQTKRNYAFSQLRNKFNQLRIRQKDFANLIKEPGINWNPVTGTVTATDEVWECLYKVYKYAKRFRKKGCPLFHKLCLIYGDKTSSGFNQDPSTNSPQDTNDLEDIASMDLEASMTDHSFDLGAQSAVPLQNRVFFPSNSRRAKRASLSPSQQTCALSSLSDNSQGKPEMMEKRIMSASSSSRSTSETGSDLKVLIIESMQALNALEGIDGVAYSKAVERFHEDYMWMELFLQMTKERKRDWVLNLK